ncbi:flagellar basal body P-ring formation chaperone FlgA [Labrenzia sp. OB1]|uniref:flagellar basal body P-ring formation chaperone FlgA n=1 Tax=Labrenzia sp. OB1 TaxID=1561204 RepID=UPI0007B2F2AF|nr:flagellar basal body P-ring formation chaperone FlgA [Labrenzia sp. OB1]KZM47643.1 flagellar basal body P-ring biosynthesis protein FlgA [Labrenzia sp. OB1]
MMKHLLKTATALLLAALASGVSVAEERPILRSQVLTLSDIVTVGDFYSNAGLLAPKPLFRSPDMGTSGNVSADVVAQRARAAGLELAGTDGLRSVVVHRGATRFDRGRLEGLVRTALAERNAGVDADNLNVRLVQAPEQILADPKVTDPVRIDRVDWQQSNGRFTIFATVAVEHGTQAVTLSGSAVEMIEVVTLSQPLRRGDILSEDELAVIRLPRSKVPAGAIVDAEEITGKEARTSLRANAPLARHDFRHPVLVGRGEKVTVTFELAGMKLTSRAQAMDDGAKGDVIDVMNLQSRRIVPATVASRGQVRVQTANPVVASLNSETK